MQGYENPFLAFSPTTTADERVCQAADVCGRKGTCTAGAASSDLDSTKVSVTCACEADYFGDGCQNSTLCDDVNCFQGTCVVDRIRDRGECECEPGYIAATDCEVFDFCTSNPCLHGTTCRNIQDDFLCSCPTTLSGKRCEVDERACTIAERCSGRGICSNGLAAEGLNPKSAAYSCACQAGFFGDDCEQGSADQGASTGSDDNSGIMPIIIGAAAGGLLLLILVIVLLMRRNRKDDKFDPELGEVKDANIWEIDRKMVRLGEKLGVSKGAWGGG